MGAYARYLTLDWTPQTVDIGTHIICIQVQDYDGGTQLCEGGNQHCFFINVQINPCFNGGTLVALNPATYSLAQCQVSFDPANCNCTCPPGGTFSGVRCEGCATGYYGPTCLPCPSCVSGQGACSSGVSGNGACICQVGWIGPSCNTTNSVKCDPNAPSSIKSGSTVSSAQSPVNPISASLLMTTTASLNYLDYSVAVNITSNTLRIPDIICIQDTSNQGVTSGPSTVGTTGTGSGETIINMQNNAATFFSWFTTRTDLMFAGVATFDGNTVGSYKLRGAFTIDSTQFASAFSAVTATSITSSDSGDVPLSAIESAISDVRFSFRPFSARYVACFVNKPLASLSAARIATFKTNLASANVVPIFFTVASGTLSSLTSLVSSLGFGYATTLTASNGNWATVLSAAVTTLLPKPQFAVVDVSPAWVTTIPTAPACSAFTASGCPVGVTNYNFRITVPASNPPTATVRLVVLGFGESDVTMFVNQAPTAVNSAITGNENTPIDYTLGANDPDNNILLVKFITIPAHGVLEHVRGSGNIITAAGQTATSTNGVGVLNGLYTPNQYYCGPDSFQYLVNDGCINSNTATLSITVICVNQAPVCTNPSCITFNENSNTTINFDGYVSDVDNTNAQLQIKIKTLPTSFGTLYDGTTAITNPGTFISSNGKSLVFVPIQYANGQTSFTYSVQDPSSATSTDCTINLCITHVNQCPTITALPATITAKIGTLASTTVTVTDPDVGDTFSVVLVSNTVPYAGSANTMTLEVHSGTAWTSATVGTNIKIGTTNLTTSFNIDYQSSATASGNQGSFVLKAVDALGLSCNPVTVTVAAGNNTPPVIILYHNYQVLENSCVNLTLTGTDIDVGQPANLKLYFNTLTTHGPITEIGSTVPIVTNANMIYSATVNGKVNETQYYATYCPTMYYNGQDCFTYTVQDIQNANSIPRTDCITVIPVNNPPTTQNVTAYTREGQCVNVSIPGFDPDGPADVNALTLTIQTPITIGSATSTNPGTLNFAATNASAIQGLTVSKDPSGTWTFTYCTPAYQHSSPIGACYATFTYKVTDPGGLSSSNATGCIVVANVNNPPVCTYTNSVIAFENTPMQINLTGTDPDTEDIGFLVAVITDIIPGSLGTLRNGSTQTSVQLTVGTNTGNTLQLWYIPQNLSCGVNPIFTFYYQIRDPTGLLSPTCQVPITVQCTNQPPYCGASLCFQATEDVKTNVIVPIYDDFFNDPTKSGVKMSLTSIPASGTLFVRNCDNGCMDVAITQAEVTASGANGYPTPSNQLVYLAPLNQNSGVNWAKTCNYDKFCVRLTDPGGLYASCCYNITVQPVNDPPVIIPFYNVTNGVGNIQICENTYGILDFNLTDVDSPVQVLRAFVSLFPSPTGLTANAKLYWCNQINKTLIPADCIIPSHLLNQTARNTEILPIAPGIFRLIFVPDTNSNAGDDIYTTIQIIGYDNSNDSTNASIPSTIQIKVRPVNQAPVIDTPQLINSVPQATVILQPITMADVDLSTDERNLFTYVLTVQVVTGRGILWFTPSVAQQAFKKKSATLPAPCVAVPTNKTADLVHSPWILVCTEVLNTLQTWSNSLTFTPFGQCGNITSLGYNVTSSYPTARPIFNGKSFSNASICGNTKSANSDPNYDLEVKHVVNYTLNDEGNIGGASCSNLSGIIFLIGTNQTVITLVIPAIVAGANHNVLTGVIAGVAALALLLLAVIAIIARNALSAVPADYFAPFAGPAANVGSSPLYVESGNNGVNPLFGDDGL